MSVNEFEGSRIAEGTLRRGAQHVSFAPAEVPATESHDIIPANPYQAHVPSRDAARSGTGPSDAATSDKSSPEVHSGQFNKPRRRRVLGATTLTGDGVRNSAGDDLGKIEEIMLDLQSGRVAYAVLSFGGFLGIGDKLFMVPWNVLRLDQSAHEFVLDIPKQVLETAPGFDKNNWPDMTNPDYVQGIQSHYNPGTGIGGDASSPGCD